MLMPATGQDEDGVLRMTEALRSDLHKFDLHAHRLTCSFGLTVWRPAEVLDTPLARADSALYRAKQEGRDRLAIAA